MYLFKTENKVSYKLQLLQNLIEIKLGGTIQSKEKKNIITHVFNDTDRRKG